jgi:hypothetical protein
MTAEYFLFAGWTFAVEAARLICWTSKIGRRAIRTTAPAHYLLH